jgi:integrase
MSTFQRPKSPYYQFSFWLGGTHYQGSTREKSKRQADQYERDLRKEIQAKLKAGRKVSGLTFEAAAEKYREEVVEHYHSEANKREVTRSLARLSLHFGPDTPLSQIDTQAVLDLITMLRSQKRGGREFERCALTGELKPTTKIKPSTINRRSVLPLKYLLTRARKVWKIDLPDITWSDLMLKESKERPREVRAGEELNLAEALPPAYARVVQFARVSGLRLNECLPRKDQVDLVGGYIYLIGKGNKKIAHPISKPMRRILMEAMANPTLHVFARPDRWTGELVAVKAGALDSAWQAARSLKKGAKIPVDLRFHDLRHDFATKLLRKTGNLKLVSKALHHESPATTDRYAHVLDEEVVAGMDLLDRQEQVKHSGREVA